MAVFVGVAGLSIVAQIMYPSGRTLPLSHLEGNGYSGFQTISSIEQKTRAINSQPITVTTRSSSVDTSYDFMGIRANPEKTFKELSDYPLEKRLIPFSILFASLEPTKINRDINVAKLNRFYKKYSFGYPERT